MNAFAFSELSFNSAIPFLGSERSFDFSLYPTLSLINPSCNSKAVNNYNDVAVDFLFTLSEIFLSYSPTHMKADTDEWQSKFRWTYFFECDFEACTM